MDNSKKAYFYGLSAVLIWSTVASAFKISLRHIDHFQLLLVADTVSVIALFVILCLQKKLSLLKKLKKKNLLRSLFLGILNPFLYYIILFKAYDLLPAQEAQPLNYTWAITLTLLSIPLLKHKIGVREIVAIFISYFGVVIISTHGDPFSLEFSNTTGVCLALASTIIWALYWIYNTKDNTDPVVGLFLNFVFGFPFILIVTVIFSTPVIASTAGLAGATYVGIFEMGITFVFWLNAMKLSTNTAKISTLIFFSPFLSLVFIHFFVGETIRISTIAGLIFIIAGNALQQLKK